MTTEERERNGVDEGGEDAVAFVVVRNEGVLRVIDLPGGGEISFGKGADETLRVAGANIQERHAVFRWDGERVRIEPANGGLVHRSGKPIEGAMFLDPGDELQVGSAQLVVGVSSPLASGGRRALTHHEFRERLYEELARASRGSRPTALVMIHAKMGEGGRLATYALEAFRAGDVVGSYATDELEFLLPDTSAETARMVVERILERCGVTASVGLAVSPDDGDSPERLFWAARSALKEALREGYDFARPVGDPGELTVPTAYDKAMKSLLGAIDDAAKEASAVLITGESGTGKSMFARMLHHRSPQKPGPMVVIPCAAIVDAKDVDRAFGPTKEPGGEIATAKGGSVVLEEVSELDEDAQKRLAKALEAVGSAVRIISTSPRALVGLVERGAFDRALFDRLALTVLEVPPLRSRAEDILPLAELFAVQSGAPRPVKFSPGAVARLRSYPWPGNVLELWNAMERAVQLAGEGELLAEHLPSEPMPIVPTKGRLREHVDSVERDAIIKALADCNQNQTHAARRLGLSRRALIYKMEKYGLKPPPRPTRRPSSHPPAS
ncbi:MAG: sigma 54-interacting transcriptional regulator [Polyangiales bacterium]